MSDPENPGEIYLRRIERRNRLSQAARAAFLALPTRTEEYATYRDIVREGERPERCCLLVEGFASRYKTLANGGRQINSFHFPGDLVDLQSSLLMVADHGIRTHAPSTIVSYDSQDILRIFADYPEWGRAMWFDTLVDAAIFREWMLNVGRRSAVSRVAHLLLEIEWRLADIGRSADGKFTMPVTQADLADAVGLSPVHTNRSLQRLREEGLIRTYGKTVVIEDRVQLARLAGFYDTYLHPEGPRLALAG